MKLRFVVVAFAACTSASGVAQPAPAPGRIPTVTRLVKLFSGLEKDLVVRAHAKDAAALDAVLDPSFELRAGNAPGTPVPRDAWIREARAAQHAPPQIDQMAVHDFGDIAIVSFRETTDGSARRGSPRFVVDCWKRDGNSWKLAVRYASDVPAQRVKPPNAAATVDKRY